MQETKKKKKTKTNNFSRIINVQFFLVYCEWKTDNAKCVWLASNVDKLKSLNYVVTASETNATITISVSM